MKVGIINVTGYAGSELARILHRHPEVEITSVTGPKRRRAATWRSVPPPVGAGPDRPARVGRQP